MNASRPAIVDGEKYALWSDGTFCKLRDIQTHLHSKGADYIEVVGIGRDDLTLEVRSTVRRPCRAVPRLAPRIRPYIIKSRD